MDVRARTRMLVWLFVACSATPVLGQDKAQEWKEDWAVAEGFALRIDTEGYRFPTSIAVVPNPGTDPRDPLYFVTELQGTIKVVTNDRTVHIFARVPAPVTDTLPAAEAEVGLAGICLEPRRGYVFATYAYRDADGVLRNALVRFQSLPRRFGVRALDSLVVRKLFSRDVAAVSHQIGPCQATANALFVSVGDGEHPARSQDLRSTLGKILKLDHAGRPAPGNPFAVDSNSAATAAIWAAGLRNPFGLELVGDRLFAADNGNQIDRFVEITRGRNYLWDGSDRSIGAAADQILAPTLAPVQLDYCDGAGLPGQWRERFYLALAGRPVDSGPQVKRRGKGVMLLDYSLAERRMRAPPKYLVLYRGTHPQSVVGVGCGPDRLYIVPLFPDAAGRSAVLTARYDPDSAHPYSLFSEADPLAIMEEKNCFGCHELGGRGGQAGPPLDYDVMVPRLRRQLNSPEYPARVRAADSIEAEPFSSYREERARVLRTSGDDRLLLWTRYRIREPKFDAPESQMPNLGLSDAEAVSLAQFLLTPPEPEVGAIRRVGRFVDSLSPRRRRQLTIGLILTFGAGGIAGAVTAYFVGRWRRGVDMAPPGS
jgi:hypothetical protein